jgi:hypothetical protein
MNNASRNNQPNNNNNNSNDRFASLNKYTIPQYNNNNNYQINTTYQLHNQHNPQE